MLETPHALVAAAIAAKIPNPVISLPLAFASHFVLDMTPHWNPHINTELKRDGKVSNKSIAIIGLDLGLTTVSTLAIASTSSTPLILLFAAFLGMLPDIIEAPYFFFKNRHPFLLKWLKFQKSIQVDVGIIPGILTQIFVTAAAIWWIFS